MIDSMNACDANYHNFWYHKFSFICLYQGWSLPDKRTYKQVKLSFKETFKPRLLPTIFD